MGLSASFELILQSAVIQVIHSVCVCGGVTFRP